MNANARFLNEAKELEPRWAKTLEGVDKKFDRRSAAVLLECQRLHNETGTWDCCDDCKEREKQEKATALVINDTRTMIAPEPKKRKLQPWWLQQIRKQLMIKGD